MPVESRMQVRWAGIGGVAGNARRPQLVVSIEGLPAVWKGVAGSSPILHAHG
jgi:hypothetical protein